MLSRMIGARSQQLLTRSRIPAVSMTAKPTFFKQQLPYRAFGTSLASKAAAGRDTFMDGTAATYVEEMYAAWRNDPSSVHASWNAYFKGVNSGVKPGDAFAAPPPQAYTGGLAAGIISARPSSIGGGALPMGSEALASSLENGKSDPVLDHLKVQLLVRAYQVRGHQKAALDPLGIEDQPLKAGAAPELEPEYYGFTEADMSRKFALGPGILPGFVGNGSDELTLGEILQHLKSTYSGTIGLEYMHIPDRAQCDWLRQRVEIPNRIHFSKEEKWMILDRLMWGDTFERFVASKYVSERRFGLEGCEALIPGMKAMIDRSVDNGVESIVIGMPHRGRLNVLSNVVRKPNESIFCEFSGTIEPSLEGSGDVKYHLGMNYDRPTPSGKRVHLSLVANPSHLEAVNPVVLGKTRAIQHFMNDEATRDRSMAVLLHGDAAFSAQGVVYETNGFTDLPSYTTGGVVHIVVNNQIGFTTDPRFSRSTMYCTDIAKSIDAPVLHVNADDVEAVTFATKLAADWRKTFKKDVVVDLVCYRRHGHNENDQPAFTQPLMYKKIAKQTTVLDQYIAKLTSEGTFTAEEIEANRKRILEILEESYAASKTYKPTSQEWLSSTWPGFKSPAELAVEVMPTYPTGSSMDTLRHVGKFVSSAPAGFEVHPQLKRILAARAKSINEEKGLDWATGEAMAFGSLLMEGKHVRLSGQDVERGTFSHRHSVLHNQAREESYTPLANLSPTQPAFTVCNSSLSEYGVLGYELGYSMVNPNALVMWEAQFGDFCNTAQVILDQFIASGEKKWLQRTGLVVILPHGYDGAGPEHSSGRIERFLQMCDDHPYRYPTPEKMARQHQDCNMQVAYCTTPANFYHVLRRQIYRDFRKPLILFTSKKLLRHPQARSTMAEISGDTFFRRYIPDPHEAVSETDTADQHLIKDVAPEDIKTHIICSGQVYYALLQARQQNNLKHIAISRIEQVSPFPFDLVKEHADKYPNAETVWCQEESLNMGSWFYVEPRIRTALAETQHHKGKGARYAGRAPSAAVATGIKKQHMIEEWFLLSEALVGEARKPKEVVAGVPIF